MTVKRRSALMALALGLAGTHARAGAYEDFFVAIMRDDASSINALLRRGFDPNTRDPKGQVGLVIALQQGSSKAFAALMASRTINVEAVKALIARGADVNKTGWAPLHYAASAGTPQHTAIIALLLENHAYIDATSPNGTTPLMMAAHYGSNDAVQLLLDEGADPTLKNELGLSAVDFATRVSRTESAEKIAAAIRRRQPNRGRW